MAQGGWNPPPGAPPPGGYGPPGGNAPPPGGYGPPGGYAPPQQPPGAYQPPMPQAPPAASPAWTPPSANQAKGFFAGLFDFTFETFVALKVIKVLYALFLLVLGLGILGGFGAAVISMIQGQVLAGLGMIIVLPFAAIIYLVMGRVYFELIIVAFKIAEDADEIARNTRK